MVTNLITLACMGTEMIFFFFTYETKLKIGLNHVINIKIILKLYVTSFIDK